MVLVRLSDWLTRTLMVLGAVWAFALCFLILADIIFRALNMPLSGTKELVANSVVIILFMQIGFAVRSGSMLRATFLVDMMPPAARKLLAVLGLLAGAAVFLLLVHAGITPGAAFAGERRIRRRGRAARAGLAGAFRHHLRRRPRRAQLSHPAAGRDLRPAARLA